MVTMALALLSHVTPWRKRTSGPAISRSLVLTGSGWTFRAYVLRRTLQLRKAQQLFTVDMPRLARSIVPIVITLDVRLALLQKPAMCAVKLAGQLHTYVADKSC